MILGVALKRAFVNRSELSAVTIRAVLLADIAADLFQLKPDGRNGIAPGPEMLAREIPFLAAQPGNRNGALPFEKPDHRSHRVLGGNGDAHVHMVRHQMPFENLAFLFAAPAHGKSVPDVGVSDRRWLSAAVWARIQHGTLIDPPHRWSSSHLRRILLRERSNLFESHWSNQWLTNFSQATNEPEISVFSVDFPSKFTDRLETIWQSSGAQQNLPGPRLPLEPTS